MGVIEGRTWLEILSESECWRLVSGAEIGRLAVLVDGVPEIFPVNHVVHAETVVFRTDAGSKLLGLLDHPLVCFEVDGADPTTRAGWSVMVKGRAAELTSGADVADAARLPLEFWARGEKSHWIRITPSAVTGRRIYRATEPTPRDPVDQPETDSRGYR
jgi:nitroimidazol reductase NimA-like FMN-containing flavoprotein (pyridoxamine 5'-phosphate oxidase superfamily)